MNNELETIKQQIEDQDWRTLYISLLSVELIPPEMGMPLIASKETPTWLKRLVKDLIPRN